MDVSRNQQGNQPNRHPSKASAFVGKGDVKRAKSALNSASEQGGVTVYSLSDTARKDFIPYVMSFLTHLRSTSPNCSCSIDQIISIHLPSSLSVSSPQIDAITTLPGFISSAHQALFLYVPALSVQFDSNSLGYLLDLAEDVLYCASVCVLLDRPPTLVPSDENAGNAVLPMLAQLIRVGGFELVDSRLFGLDDFVCLGREL